MSKVFSHLGYAALITSLCAFSSLGCGPPVVHATVSAPRPPSASVRVSGPAASVSVRAPAPPHASVTVRAPGPPTVRVAANPPTTGPTYRPTTEEWVHMPARILYPSGGSRLDDTARAMLREAHASMAHRTDIIRVRVEGHADGQGSQAANERLGMERAQGVVDFMVGELGLPRELFEVQSFGDQRPITSETDARDRVQNRRVEFSFLVRRQAAP